MALPHHDPHGTPPGRPHLPVPVHASGGQRRALIAQIGREYHPSARLQGASGLRPVPCIQDPAGLRILPTVQEYVHAPAVAAHDGPLPRCVICILGIQQFQHKLQLSALRQSGFPGDFPEIDYNITDFRIASAGDFLCPQFPCPPEGIAAPQRPHHDGFFDSFFPIMADLHRNHGPVCAPPYIAAASGQQHRVPAEFPERLRAAIPLALPERIQYPHQSRPLPQVVMEIQEFEALYLRRPAIRLQLLLVEPELVLPGAPHEILRIGQDAVGPGILLEHPVIPRLQVALELADDAIIGISADLPQLMADDRLLYAFQGRAVISAPPAQGIANRAAQVRAVSGAVEIDEIRALNPGRGYVIEPAGLGGVEPPAPIS